MMAPAAAALEAFIAGISLKPPSIPILSTVTGRELSPQEAVDPRHWARQILNPVLFQSAVMAAGQGDSTCFLEVGPGGGLSTLVKQSLPGASVHSMGMREGGELSEASGLLAAVGEVWSSGAGDVGWSRLASGVPWRRLSLPGHPFSRRRHWIDPRPPGGLEGTGEGYVSTSLREVMAVQRKLIGRQADLLRRVTEGHHPEAGGDGH